MTQLDHGTSPIPAPSEPHASTLLERVSVFARLGRWTATRLRLVLLSWLAILVVFGIFAPHVETALSGAGWQDSSSASVQARNLIQRDFSGLGSAALEVVVVDHHGPIASDPAALSLMNKAAALLRADARVSKVVMPIAGTSISRNGRTAIITTGSAAGTNVMVTAANDLAGPIQKLSGSGVTLTLTGDSALWADFNNANRSAMLRSEMLSWPVTMIILVIAFGSLVAAGLPLLLTMVGLLVAAGALVMLTHAFPVSIWALNFALMFALALGIDYALFIVVRFRSALKRRGATPGDRDVVIASVAETMDTAGKAVAFSAITVLASLASILLVPSPAFRSMALGIMLSVVAVLAATLTLLPAVLGRLGTRINKGQVRFRRRHPDPGHPGRLDIMLHSWGRTMWRHPAWLGLGALAVLLLAATPVIGLRTNMPSITIIPATANARIGYNEVASAFGPGAPGPLQVLVPPRTRKRHSPRSRSPRASRACRRDRPRTAGASTRSSRRRDLRRPRPRRPSYECAPCCPRDRSSAGPRRRTTTSSSRCRTTPPLLACSSRSASSSCSSPSGPR
jgi:RND superfamily putative drug exporter